MKLKSSGMEFSRPEYWSGLPFPSPGDLPNLGLEPRSPTLRADLYQLSHQGSPRILEWVAYPFISGSSQPRNWAGSPELQLDSLPTGLSGKLIRKLAGKEWRAIKHKPTLCAWCVATALVLWSVGMTCCWWEVILLVCWGWLEDLLWIGPAASPLWLIGWDEPSLGRDDQPWHFREPIWDLVTWMAKYSSVILKLQHIF